MKFQKLESFEKHFKEAYPKHLSAIYAVICGQESERKKILASLTHLLEKECDLKRCHLVKEALEQLNSGSLFSGKVAAVVDMGEDAEIELLSKYIAAPNPKGHLILGAGASKNITPLYAAGKKRW